MLTPPAFWETEEQREIEEKQQGEQLPCYFLTALHKTHTATSLSYSHKRSTSILRVRKREMGHHVWASSFSQGQGYEEKQNINIQVRWHIEKPESFSKTKRLRPTSD